MILVLDNYDSFTFNLVHLLRSAGEEVGVVRSDRITVDEALARRPTHLVISPGPGWPEDRGISVPLIRSAAGRIPVLGVCLGHQAIAVAFGGRVKPAPAPVHGKVSSIRHGRRGVFRVLPEPLRAMRYHSLVVDRSSLPEDLEVTAWLDDGEETIMGLRHRDAEIHGIQFHPESFLTPDGPSLIQGFLSRRLFKNA